MLQLLEQEQGTEAVKPFIPQLRREYEYWASPGSQGKNPNPRAVRLEDGTLLNRYWDDSTAPRQESYATDVRTLQEAMAQRVNDHCEITPEWRDTVYRNIRAAAESGWDFSSRWLDEQDRTRRSIRTTEIIPVDLNCLLYNMEKQLADWTSDQEFQELAKCRKLAINKLFWDEERKYFFDLFGRMTQRTNDWLCEPISLINVWSLAAVYPLFFRIADDAQAKKVAWYIENAFLQPGGVITTLYQTGEQWDKPNGWALLQWLTIKGLENYGYHDLAYKITERFVGLVRKVYLETGKIMEKYDVCDLSKEAGGGEYPCQDGFGWTNGVVSGLLAMLKDHKR